MGENTYKVGDIVRISESGAPYFTQIGVIYCIYSESMITVFIDNIYITYRDWELELVEKPQIVPDYAVIEWLDKDWKTV